VHEELAALRAYGLNHRLAAMRWGERPHEVVERSMWLVTTEVMPALRDLSATSPGR
jgi:hypothetical protein